MNELTRLEKTIKVDFKDKQLLQTAVTHRSYLNENREIKEHNERLEFLGDAVLELATTQHLFHSMPDTPEGEMTSIRAALVRKENLDKTAHKIDLGKYLFLSRGEDQSGGRENSYILANTVEALIGAIYLDQGFETARHFIEENILIFLDEILQKNLHQDAKSRLQEICQEKMQITPNYEILDEEGPDHQKTFTAGVFFGEEQKGQGSGPSKQAAELQAAEDALAQLNW